ncbi:hypothetical protein [Halobacterium rubrum]|nr:MULTISPECIES: hypothetical protein [Halobacterium]MDH5020631.1 hypothetical protein [Halobacterium rubrum]MDH5020660.1 hypothetical protein [Halobacterium rubrum]
MPEGSSGDRADRGHLDGVPDVAGCTELWDRLSERRVEDGDDNDDDDD